jgi:HlyD family secretion protein
VELDSSKLKDYKLDQQIAVDTSQASYVNAREYLEIVKKQGEANIAVAKVNLLLAQLDLAKYRETGGEYDQELKSARNQITKLEAALERARDKMDGSKSLYEKKYITETELKADELEFQKNKLDKEVAEGTLKLLKEFTYKRKISQLTSSLDQATFEVERVTHQAKSAQIEAEAALRAKEANFEREKRKLKKIEDQIVKCRITAPVDGLVVFVKPGRRDGAQPLEEGAQLYEGQDLIRMPTADQMVAEVKIHESMLQKVKEGLRVAVTTDALPGRAFDGYVEKIAVMPDAQSWWLNPDLKVYETEVVIEEESPLLRPGMSCNADIIIEQLEDVLFVPVQAVVRIAGKPTVYVMKEGQLHPRGVETGRDNNRMIHIISGLQEGEEVALSPPLQNTTGPSDKGSKRPKRKKAPQASKRRPGS